MSRRAGVIAAALAACSPLLIWYSQEARSYELLALLTGLSLLGLRVRAARRRRRALLAAWVIACALALATHYYAALVVVPEAIWLLVIHRRRRAVQIAFGLVALCGLALIPLAIGQQATGRGNWIAHAPFGRRLGQVIPQFVAGFDGPAHSVLEPVAIAIVVLALVLLATRSDPEPRRGALLAGGIALAGLLISLALVGGGLRRSADPEPARDLGPGRAARLPVAWPRTGRGRSASWPPRRCARSGVDDRGRRGARSQPASVRTGAWWRAPWAHARRPADGPSSSSTTGTSCRCRCTSPGCRFWPGGAAIPVRELDVVSFTSPRTAGFCWWGSACNLWPSRVQARYPVAGFHAVSERHVRQFTIVRLVSSRPVRLTSDSVSHVLRSTNFVNDELLIQR